MAKACSTPGKPQAIDSSSSIRLMYRSSDSRRAPGRRGAAGVGRGDEHRVGILDDDVVVVAEGGVHDLGLLAVPLEEVGADLGMAPFQLVVGRLADVVQQAAAAGQVAVQADHLGHHAGEERHFDAVPQHVLAVAGAEVQPAQQVDAPSRAGRGTSASWAASSPFFWM